jgi:hypothetical protein
MLNLMLHRLQPFHGAVNFILAQLYVGVYKQWFSREQNEITSGLSQPEGFGCLV